MKCTDCTYYWKDEGEKWASCHFGEPSWLDVPPCEQEEIDHQRDLDREYYENLKRDIERDIELAQE